MGQRAVDVTACPAGLDVTASRTKDKIYLHVVNTNRTKSVSAKLAVETMNVKSGCVFEIAGDPGMNVRENPPDVLAPKKKKLPADMNWTFPAASVSAVKLDSRPAAG